MDLVKCICYRYFCIVITTFFVVILYVGYPCWLLVSHLLELLNIHLFHKFIPIICKFIYIELLQLIKIFYRFIEFVPFLYQCLFVCDGTSVLVHLFRCMAVWSLEYSWKFHLQEDNLWFNQLMMQHQLLHGQQ